MGPMIPPQEDAKEPALKKAKTNESLTSDKAAVKEAKKEDKENKEKKDKNGEKKEKSGEKKEKKEKDGEKKDKKDKKEKKETDGKEAAEAKKEKKERKEKKAKEGEVAGEKKEKKEKKDKSDKKEKKEKKDKKDKKEKKDNKDKPKVKDGAAAKKPKTLRQGAPQKKKHSLHNKMKSKLAAKAKEKAQGPTKVITKTEEDYEPVNRWWEQEDGALSGKRGAKKWDTFEHHGLMFAPDYEPHGVSMKYDGKEVKLSVEAEEIATYWCSVRGSEYEKKDLFIRNFWTVFMGVLPKDTVIKEFSKCDFSAISAHLDDVRQKKKEETREQKEARAKENAKKKEWYSHALVNGIREKLGAVGMEPPQLFRGRGEHPKQGLLKKRTFPESCTLNIAEDAPVPKVIGLPGHAWKDVVHENTVQWIASFEDALLGETKYVSFAATSGLKGQPDMLKYDRARRLLGVIDKVRASYEKLQKSTNIAEQQKATATYFIDKLALRVGGEKNTEEEADTVGCCSLRVEHLTLEPPRTIVFDFLGKDSIRYHNAVEVTDVVYENIGKFMRGKKPEEDVFDKCDPSILNEYFKEFMDDLTAKVFRTFNASYTLQKELAKFDLAQKDQFSQDQLVKFYNDANRQVAILCNHQKAESKTHGAAMEKMAKQKDDFEKTIKALKKHMQALEKGETPKSQDKMPKDALGCKKKIAETKMRLEKHVHVMEEKEENKLVSLGTSKVNYMDPRITVAFCKKVDLAIEKVFPRTVRTKFPWAMHFKSSYVFD